MRPQNAAYIQKASGWKHTPLVPLATSGSHRMVRKLALLVLAAAVRGLQGTLLASTALEQCIDRGTGGVRECDQRLFATLSVQNGQVRCGGSGNAAYSARNYFHPGPCGGD